VDAYATPFLCHAQKVCMGNVVVRLNIMDLFFNQTLGYCHESPIFLTSYVSKYNLRAFLCQVLFVESW